MGLAVHQSAQHHEFDSGKKPVSIFGVDGLSPSSYLFPQGKEEGTGVTVLGSRIKRTEASSSSVIPKFVKHACEEGVVLPEGLVNDVVTNVLLPSNSSLEFMCKGDSLDEGKDRFSSSGCEQNVPSWSVFEAPNDHTATKNGSINLGNLEEDSQMDKEDVQGYAKISRTPEVGYPVFSENKSKQGNTNEFKTEEYPCAGSSMEVFESTEGNKEEDLAHAEPCSGSPMDVDGGFQHQNLDGESVSKGSDSVNIGGDEGFNRFGDNKESRTTQDHEQQLNDTGMKQKDGENEDGQLNSCAPQEDVDLTNQNGKSAGLRSGKKEVEGKIHDNNDELAGQASARRSSKAVHNVVIIDDDEDDDDDSISAHSYSRNARGFYGCPSIHEDDDDNDDDCQIVGCLPSKTGKHSRRTKKMFRRENGAGSSKPARPTSSGRLDGDCYDFEVITGLEDIRAQWEEAHKRMRTTKGNFFKSDHHDGFNGNKGEANGHSSFEDNIYPEDVNGSGETYVRSFAGRMESYPASQILFAKEEAVGVSDSCSHQSEAVPPRDNASHVNGDIDDIPDSKAKGRVFDSDANGRLHEDETMLASTSSSAINLVTNSKRSNGPGKKESDSEDEKIQLANREWIKQTVGYKDADEQEWANRQREIEKQALEAQRLRKRKKAEADRKSEMENRQKQRLEEVRESQLSEERNISVKEQLRGRVLKELDAKVAGCIDMASLLRRLGIPVEGGIYCTPSQVNAAYKKALFKFHPDRSGAIGQDDLHSQVEAEETFKIIVKLKNSLRPVASSYYPF